MIQRAKKVVFAPFPDFFLKVNLILRNVIVPIGFQQLATLPGHERPFRNHKNAFLNDAKVQEIDFWLFLDLS